jgi:hypothetical protein
MDLTITILDIIHLPVFYFRQIWRQDVATYLHVEPAQVGPIDRASLSLETSW